MAKKGLPYMATDALIQMLDAALFDSLLTANKHSICCGAKGCRVHNNGALFRDVLPNMTNYTKYTITVRGDRDSVH